MLLKACKEPYHLLTKFLSYYVESLKFEAIHSLQVGWHLEIARGYK
jgi:hypothetical protein